MPTTLSRQHYLAKNICPNCKCRELKEGYKNCEVCYNATRDWMVNNRSRKDKYNKERYETLRSQGLCVVCKNPTEGNVYCKNCTTKKSRTRAFNRPLHSRNRWAKR